MWKANERLKKEDEDDKEDEEDMIVKGHASRLFLGNLEPFTEYKAKVRVLNELYAGPYSEEVSFLTAEDGKALCINLLV